MSEISKYLKTKGIEPKETDYGFDYNFLCWLLNDYHRQQLEEVLGEVKRQSIKDVRIINSGIIYPKIIKLIQSKLQDDE